MYEMTFRLGDGSRLRIEVGLLQVRATPYAKPAWCVRMWRCQPRKRTFKCLYDGWVGRVPDGFRAQLDEAIYAAWQSLKPDPIK